MSLKRSLIASALMILTIVALNYLSHPEKIRPNKPLSTFPKQIGEWIGKEERFDQRIYDVLGVDDSFLCNYSSPSGDYVQLYVGFYESQREGDLIHSPKHCMPGAGWDIIRTSTEEMTIPNSNPGRLKMNKLLLKKDDQQQVMLYWFQSRGRLIVSEYMQKIYLVIDSITRHRTDGSFVRVISPVKDGSEDLTSDATKGFVELLFPVLQAYLPS
ncbi:MAG: exosortase C-terminal domain/associated protein EpsI [Candidatus Thorarchaeota archaeon]